MKKWTKILGVLIVAALGIAALAGVAMAQGPQDADGDGLCDECGAETGGLMQGWRFDGEERGRGQSQGAQPGRGGPDAGQGQIGGGASVCDDWIDEDGDGVCDNHPSGEAYGPQGTGRMGRQFGEGEDDWRGQGPQGSGQGMPDNCPQGGQDGQGPMGGGRGGRRFNQQAQ